MRRWWRRGGFQRLQIILLTLFPFLLAGAFLVRANQPPPTLSSRDLAPTSLAIRLLPRRAPTPGIAVYLDLDGPAIEGLRGLALAPGPSEAMPRHLLVKDGRGVVRVQDDAGGRIRFARPVRGRELHVSYLVEEPENSSRFDVQVSDEGVFALGYRLLALPDLQTTYDVELTWQTRSVPVKALATSLGTGTTVRATASTFDLAHGFYLAGDLRTLEGPGGHRIVVRGPTAVSDEVLLAHTTKLWRTAGSMFADDPDPEPHTVFVMSDETMGPRLQGLAFRHSFAAWVGPEHELDERMTLLLAHETTHRWIGGAVTLVDDRGREASWFAEGFSVHFARELALRAGLVDEAALARDIGRDLDQQRAAFLAPRPQRPQRRTRMAPLTHPSPDYHRGALYAARLDAQLRGRGHPGLLALVRALLADAPEGRGAIPIESFRERLVHVLGPEAAVELEELAIRGVRPVEVPTLSRSSSSSGRSARSERSQ